MSNHRPSITSLFTIALILTVVLGVVLSYASEEGEAPSSSELGIPRLDKYDSVYVSVGGTADVESHKKFKKVSAILQDTLAKKLKDSDVFQNVSTKKPEQTSASDLVISLSVNKFVYTGGGGRIMGGIMAGKAKLGMLVSLTDGESGETLVESPLSTTSKLKHGVFGGTTQRQINKMTDIIAEEIIAQKK